MNLYYIYLGLDYNDYILKNNELRFEFQKKTSFINDYFSKKARKLRFKTDGTFNMISISPSEFVFDSKKYVPSDVLDVHLPFDRNRYDTIKNTEDCSYYLELLDQGFKKASQFKEIPLESLLNIIKEFEQEGCVNKWLYKKKRFKDDDLEIVLDCEFTAICFQLVISINQISTKKSLVNGVIMRTEVGVSIHEGMYKDILIDDNNIIITDRSDSPRVKLNKNKVLKGVLDFVVLGDKEIVDMLTYPPLVRASRSYPDSADL